MPGSADAGSTEDDAREVPVTGAANSADSDTGEPAPVADAGCSPVTLYRDRDGDGFGSDAPEDVVQGCLPMPGFALEGGDCHDAQPTMRDPAGAVFYRRLSRSGRYLLRLRLL
jgi:hypothetical protein